MTSLVKLEGEDGTHVQNQEKGHPCTALKRNPSELRGPLKETWRRTIGKEMVKVD